MNKSYFVVLIYFVISINTSAQKFDNSDLDGVCNAMSSLPIGWETVPASFIYCYATNPGITDTPDLADSIGPAAFIGVFGIPYSGTTYLSGSYAKDTSNGKIWHEGIQQNVSGFLQGNTYKINFHQAVDASTSTLDQSGSWAVYIDDQLVGISVSTYSAISALSNHLEWQSRSISFIATKSAHIIGFLPYDDDADIGVSTSNLSGALRMGIDSIYLSVFDFKMPNVFTPNADGYNDKFIPIELVNSEGMSIVIYNRWGQKIFESNDLNAGWDGNQNNNPVSPGTYYWLIENKKKYFTGYVMLLR